jgi:hypothetical protein
MKPSQTAWPSSRATVSQARVTRPTMEARTLVQAQESAVMRWRSPPEESPLAQLVVAAAVVRSVRECFEAPASAAAGDSAEVTPQVAELSPESPAQAAAVAELALATPPRAAVHSA